MFNSKIRNTIIALGAGATVFASAAVASAAMVVRPGSVGVRPPIPQTTVTYLDPGKVGGAGQPGYDNAKCEQMANNLNNATNKLQTDNAKGDLAGVQIDTVLVESWASQIGDHCLVVD
jgi:hypothetical protein